MVKWLKPFLLGLCLGLTSCGVFSPENRMGRLCKKNPELCEYEKVDTQLVIREYTPLDTQKVTNKIDSFIIHKDKVITRIYRNYDTITVNQIQAPDTSLNIVKERSFTVSELPDSVKVLVGAFIALFACFVVIVGLILLRSK
jgi:hypothetical protein